MVNFTIKLVELVESFSLQIHALFGFGCMAFVLYKYEKSRKGTLAEKKVFEKAMLSTMKVVITILVFITGVMALGAIVIPLFNIDIFSFEKAMTYSSTTTSFVILLLLSHFTNFYNQDILEQKKQIAKVGKTLEEYYENSDDFA